MLNLFMTFMKLGKDEVNARATLSASGADNSNSSLLVLLLIVASAPNSKLSEKCVNHRSISFLWILNMVHPKYIFWLHY